VIEKVCNLLQLSGSYWKHWRGLSAAVALLAKGWPLRGRGGQECPPYTFR
jgi:hypothetical protein